MGKRSLVADRHDARQDVADDAEMPQQDVRSDQQSRGDRSFDRQRSQIIVLHAQFPWTAWDMALPREIVSGYFDAVFRRFGVASAGAGC